MLGVLDKVRAFGRLGDSLGLGENAYRLLERWGCNVDEIKAIGNQAPLMSIRRWRDGRVLVEQPLMDMAVSGSLPCAFGVQGLVERRAGALRVGLG